MAKASIHFKAVKASSESHNERSARLDYNFPDLEKDNESWTTDRISERKEKIFKYCKETSGRKMQKNAQPIKEAVVNLDSHHTMADLQRLAQELKKQKGIDCFQIHIHRDEGKDRQNLNYHAHMIFDWQDRQTGKTLKLNRLDISQIQTIVAETLGMERGILKENSNRERLEAVEYKRQQEEKRVQELKKEIEEWEERYSALVAANERTQERNRSLEAKLSDLSALQEKAKERNNEIVKALRSNRKRAEKLAGKMEKAIAESIQKEAAQNAKEFDETEKAFNKGLNKPIQKRGGGMSL